ncbi:component of SufBCD complex [Aquicoccus porphyridii]|uniref:Component of SufBCD complex n=1 Tax=Aquicoccus porphyridii TaxID=1852029 RepID=A0A5A9ZVP1_9RHOB|nr:component of SufBCD complex [Aquicoccus porphyridii]KAA0920996.1 component of SufBCD complex [Aquicoccus porphyridii]RAI56466.1 component of SufBCD complex [Rhodobacteraceae bacterium AsT-22]
MDWHQTIFELIDMRSFSNLWFWIALAVMWSTASHWVLGVPWDIVLRARREGGQFETDFEDLVRIYTGRLLYIARVSGLWLLGFACFFLTLLGMLGFLYGFEFGQALFLLGFPMAIVGALSLNTARLIRERGEHGEALYRRLHRHRIIVQVIGMVSIFVTALWGMFQNLAVGPFG